MGDVRPFCGLRYDLQRIPDPSAIITPPYDVISSEERDWYYRRSPYNIIRLEFGEEHPGDSTSDNKYTRAAATLDEWLREGILIREEQPALYIVEHRFLHQDIERSRRDLICTVQLEDYDTGHVRPHEQTTKEAAVDRLHLLRSCRVNFSAIMGLVRTEQGELSALLGRLSEKAPDMIAGDSEGVSYHLWAVTDASAIGEVRRLLTGKVIYIADGHHRYETALRYEREQCAARSSCTGGEPFGFVMMSLMDWLDPGLVMLPTHRLVRGLEPATVVHLQRALSHYFEVEDLLSPPPALSNTVQTWLRTLETRRKQGTVAGVYGLHGRRLCLLRLRPDADLHSMMSREELGLWKDLDVVLLQRVVLSNALGIDTVEKEARHLEYTQNGVEALSKVDSGEYQLAFFVNPAPVSSILDTADAGRRVPQKSTYFYPKTPAGLVMNPLWED